MIKKEIQEFVSSQPYQTLTELQSSAMRREIELENQRKEERTSSGQYQLTAKRFKFANSSPESFDRGVLSVASVGNVTVEGFDRLHVICVAMKDILVGIADRVHGFVSIAARRATAELVVPFSFSSRCRTLHP